MEKSGNPIYNLLMPSHAQQIQQALASVHDEASFINHLLVDALQWPIDGAPQSVEAITYDWSAAELRALELDKKLIGGGVLQLQLTAEQPWGIFILDFRHPDPFIAQRGMTGPLRRVLRGLTSKRRSAHLPVWDRRHLLFICTHNYEHFRFAYFKAPPEGEKTAPLAAFGWGPGEAAEARTACEFNLPALLWPRDSTDAAAWVGQWADAFNVEKVTKEFYREYAAEDQKLRIAVGAVMRQDKEAEQVKMFVQTLLNRLLFLRFIERKGWLIPPGDAPGRDYLRLLFAARQDNGPSFFASRLQPLFFEALAVEGHQRSPVLGRVPFLNGGLFEKNDLDKLVPDLPDAPFASLLGDDGLFYRYNFTVAESTPLEIEVAVDPEMLGKVFEELVTGRHESGSYYTPRPVVAFMCREGLKGYLANKTDAPPAALEALVDRHEIDGLTDAHAVAIREALDALNAVDPACGSGAYLLGLMQEIIQIHRLLQNQQLLKDPRTLHQLKLRIISHSLYGVDKDPFATHIAMLRLWLSLAVEADSPLPLPNLDFKIECGDSVTGPDPSQFSELPLHEKARQLAILKDQYLRAHGQEKQSLRQLIDREQRSIGFELRSLHPGAIDWRVAFPEVFFPSNGIGGGFDLVLANPPYIRQEKIKPLKPALKQMYGTDYSGTADLYVYFYLRALQLLNRGGGGQLVFISSNKWFRAGYGQKLRQKIAKEARARLILDFHDLPVFESAIAYPMIFVAEKPSPSPGTPGEGRGGGRADGGAMLAEPPNLDAPYPDIAAVVRQYAQPMPKTALGKDGAWHLASAAAADRLRKMRDAGPTLREYVQDRVYRGITTGFNDAFVIDAEKRDELLAADPASADLLKPLTRGRDIKRWRVNQRDEWLIFTRRGIDIDAYPAIKAHLSQWKRDLTPKNRDDPREKPGRKPGRYKWYEIQDDIAYFAEFEKPKIVSTKVSIEPTFAYDEDGHFLGNTAYFFPVEREGLFLLGILNSHSSKFYSQNVFVGKQNGWYEVQPAALEQIPIPAAPAAERAAIAALAGKCLDAKGEACGVWEAEIDARVAALYGV